MCGFFISTKYRIDPTEHPKLLARGPDSFRVLEHCGVNIFHSHLSIFSSEHNQPKYDHKNDMCLIFNGEIYNCPPNISEVDFILEQYLRIGTEAFKFIDGEFAIIVIDFKSSEIVVATDPFGTKPCFVSMQDGFHASSYPSALEAVGIDTQKIYSVKPNSVFCFDFRQKKVLEHRSLIEWDLEQHIDSFDQWISCFEDAVKKRANHMRYGQRPFVGISSGYDSGAIHSALINQKLGYLGISIVGKERKPELISRRKVSIQHSMEHFLIGHIEAREIIEENYHEISQLVEDLPYQITSDAREVSLEPDSVLKDKGSLGVAILAYLGKLHGARVCLSGSGADEIISDYGYKGKPIYQHSNFGGLWPEDLSKIFPWSSFYFSTQQAYIRKEESIGGAFGIETRYPFLDKRVVQAWLNINHNLKNSEYKSCIKEYLDRSDYPVVREKRGFSPWAA